jgi:hypothetical protein
LEKFIITRRSGNPITGPILVTTSPRRTCPTVCPLRKDSGNGACYAEHGMLGGFIWGKLDRLEPGSAFKQGQIRIHSKQDLLRIISSLPPGTLWRHNQAGDLPTNDGETIDWLKLSELIQANQGRSGFTYTHFDILKNAENRRVVKYANEHGFTVNLSANSLDHADALYDLGVAPVTVVVPENQKTTTYTKKGRKVIICPARVSKGMNCSTCRICAKQRKAIVAFPAIGAGRKAVV